MIDGDEIRRSGWAGGAWPQQQQLSHLPEHVPYRPAAGRAEPAYAIADAWTPPYALALPEDLCDRLLRAAGATDPVASGNGTYYLPQLDPEDEQSVIDRFAAANAAWWRLDVDRWHLGVKRYRRGERHVEHQDLHAGAAGRKLAGVVQLSATTAYDGGDLVMWFADHGVEMPRARGTLIAFPGWTVHEVTQVDLGERWSLCVNGWGPPLR